MTLNEAIEKAVAGGWDKESVIDHMAPASHNFAKAMLDRWFWESLGNALGWYVHSEKEYQLPMNDKERNKELNRLEDEVGVIIRSNDFVAVVSPYKAYQKSWKDVWHEFIDHIADGKSIESFFEQLT